MTDQINDNDVETTEADANSRRARRMFLTGAGIAGAAAVVGKSGAASAADGDNVVAGQDVASTSTTTVTNGGTSTDRSNNAIKGVISNSGNNSHTILATTVGDGHAIAGVVGTPTGPQPANPVAATWGRSYAAAAATEGQSLAEDVPLAGPANGVKGIIESETNGSHAVLGITAGAGHSVAGDTPDGDNTVAATWGRHAGQGAGIGGVNVTSDSPLAGPARGVEGVVTSASNGSHAVFGATSGAGHSIAGDTPADAAGVDGVGPNTTAATWGRHGGIGAGIGGVSAEGYGGEFIGGKSHVRLIQSADASNAGPPTDGGHLLGELYADGAGELWYNTDDGSNWVSLTRPNTGGTVLLTDAMRAFDSRSGKAPASAKGRLSAGETVEIDLTEFTDFPAGSQGALINITVVAPSPGVAGFATVFNGDTADSDRPDTSSINWDGSTGVIANSLTAKAGASGSIKVYVRQATDLIIDVIGYIG